MKDISLSSELKQIKPSREKINLLQNCLRLIDCLPDKVKRTKKFLYKELINKEIAREAQLISPPDLGLARKATEDSVKYNRAIENALSHTNKWRDYEYQHR